MGWYLCTSRTYDITFEHNSWHLLFSLWRWVVLIAITVAEFRVHELSWFYSSSVVINLQYGIPFHLLLWEKSGLWRVFLAGIAMNLRCKTRSNARKLILKYSVAGRSGWAVGDTKWLKHTLPYTMVVLWILSAVYSEYFESWNRAYTWFSLKILNLYHFTLVLFSL